MYIHPPTYYKTKFKTAFTVFPYADVNYLRLDVVNFRKTLKVDAERKSWVVSGVSIRGNFSPFHVPFPFKTIIFGVECRNYNENVRILSRNGVGSDCRNI